MKINVVIAGEAGQGVARIANILSEILVENGYYVFNYRDYQSLITGGINFNVIAFSNKPTYAYDNSFDVILLLHEKNFSFVEKAKKNAIVICDEKIKEDKIDEIEKLEKKKGLKFIYVNADEIIKKENLHKIVKNSIMLGTLLSVLGIDRNFAERSIKKQLKKYIKDNLIAFEKGYDINHKSIKLPKPTSKKLVYFNGNDAVAYAFRLAGLDIYYAYPMTPSTGVLHNLAKTLQGFVWQLENEIAVINAALGSSFGGKKVAIGTSGGGFALMIEALSLCGNAELPLVIYLASRYGPSTGAPTYTSQGDLYFALNAGHGEFAKAVIALSSIDDSLINSIKAFLFSQKYRIPVILLTDKHFAESGFTIEEDKLKKIEEYASKVREAIDILKKRKPLGKNPQGVIENYSFKDPFAPLGILGRDLVKVTSYEHDAYGFTVEDAESLAKMGKRRKQRIEAIKVIAKNGYRVYGKGKNLILAYGSVVNSLLEFLKNKKAKGWKVIDIFMLKPFPQELAREIKKAKNVWIVENSLTGQLARLIREELGIKINNLLLKHDGRPFFVDEIINGLKINKRK